MEKEKAFLLWFDQLERKDVAIAGGKSSSLGELTSHVDVPVPYGFATTACAYRYFFEKTGLYEKIKALIAGLDVDNSAQLREVCAKVRQAIMDEEMPQDLQDMIAQAYKELGEKVGQADPFVAVRSSATAEDLPDASFAGQQDTYLNVKGAETIVAKVKECYASCFTDRAVYYREKQGFDHLDVALSAAVQMMVFSKAAGVMFTVNVATGDDKNILIEGAWGLGEYVVQGTVTPDNYTVNKATCEIVEKNVNAQDIKLIRKADGDCEEVVVPLDEQNEQKLTDEQIKQLAECAKKIEAHYGCYMDMEWGVDERDNKVYILHRHHDPSGITGCSHCASEKRNHKSSGYYGSHHGGWFFPAYIVHHSGQSAKASVRIQPYLFRGLRHASGSIRRFRSCSYERGQARPVFQ